MPAKVASKHNPALKAGYEKLKISQNIGLSI